MKIPKWMHTIAEDFRRGEDEANWVPVDQAREPVVNPPAFSPRHTYGGQGTIHKTSTVDVQLDANGNVVAVWFRCLNLPFTVSLSDDRVINPRGIAIEEITYVDLPREGSSQ